MKKSYKRLLISLAILAGIYVIAAITINIYVKNRIQSLIKEELPENISASYDELNIAFFNGSIRLSNPQLIIRNKQDQQEHTFIKLENLKISHLGYWKYLLKKEIHISKISFENPEITYFKDRVQVDSTSQEQTKIEKAIFVDDFEISHGKLIVYEKDVDSLMLETKNVSFQILDIYIDQEIFARKIPIEYKSYKIKSDSLFLKAGPYENLHIASFSIDNKHGIFNKIQFKTKYSKEQLSKIIEVERDYYDLNLQSLTWNDFEFGVENDRFYGGSKTLVLDSLNLEIYRDKLVQDDPKIKSLYSKMLRELPFDLTIDSLKIKNANIRYEEKVHEENKAGSINFSDFQATIANVSNTYSAPTKTKLKLNALFMDQTPFDVEWNFDVQNQADQFVFKAQIGALNAEKMNEFTEPNLKVRVEGNAEKTYFTIDGNNEKSKTDLKINYSDFKVSVLQKDGKKKNKFISAIVNIFISKDSDSPEDNFREASAEVTRDKTKSIFNFFWISIEAALKESMTGKAKSE